MTKPVKALMFTAALLLLAGILGTVFVLRPAESSTVEIVQDGRVLYTIDLETAQDEEIIITSPEGKTNTVTIGNGTIRISAAQCPDQTCVKQGILSSESLPIVCLPHRVVIRYQEAS